MIGRRRARRRRRSSTARAGLGRGLTVDADLPGQDQRARPLARLERGRVRRAADRGGCASCRVGHSPTHDSAHRAIGSRSIRPLTIHRPMPSRRASASLRRERRVGAREAFGRQRARPLQAEERRVGRLAGGGVLAGGLAERRPTRLRRRGCRRRSGTRGRTRCAAAIDRRRSAASVAAAHDRAGDRRRADQRAGLACVHVAQRRRRRAAGATVRSDRA